MDLAPFNCRKLAALNLVLLLICGLAGLRIFLHPISCILVREVGVLAIRPPFSSPLFR